MGDRALIILTDSDRKDVSVTVYLHWGGSNVPHLLSALKTLMQNRLDDVQYGAARLIGLAHEMMPGNMSLGVWSTPNSLAKAVRDKNADKLAQASHGDAGLIVVDAATYRWQAFGGYLADAPQLALVGG